MTYGPSGSTCCTTRQDAVLWAASLVAANPLVMGPSYLHWRPRFGTGERGLALASTVWRNPLSLGPSNRRLVGHRRSHPPIAARGFRVSLGSFHGRLASDHPLGVMSLRDVNTTIGAA